jgi:hypothetical protein
MSGSIGWPLALRRNPLMTTIVDPHSLAPIPARLGPRSAFNGSHTTDSARSELLFATVFLFQGGFAFYTTFIGVYFINKFNFTS